MPKPIEEMSKEELLVVVKDYRQTLTELHMRFISGFVMELEYGYIKVEDIDPLFLKNLKRALGFI